VWLDSTSPPGEVEGLLQPAPEESLEMVPVARLVNDVRNEGPGLIEPPDHEQLAALEPA
jgi:putative SOS response-associated peptidase YedK